MSRLLKAALLAVLCLIVAAPSAQAYWAQNGVAICTATGFQYFPTIISDGAGGSIITWEDPRFGGYGNNDIYAQRVNASGEVLWTVDGVAICNVSGDQALPKLVPDGSGGAIITWQDKRYGNYDIYAQRVDASGFALWPAQGVALSSAAYSQGYPAIISDGAGGAIVTWEDLRNPSSYDIYAQRVSASGFVQWAANGVALSSATGEQMNPTITSDGASGAVVTWQDSRSGNWDIYTQRVNASGAVQWTANGVALCAATGDQLHPTIVSDGASGAIVTWFDQRSGNYDIYTQRVNASGSVQWTANGVALCATTGDQWIPMIVSDGWGGAIVTWQDNRSGIYDVYAQRVNGSGVVQWTANGVALCTAWGNQEHPAIVSDGVHGAIVTWYDTRSGSYDIYAQRVDVSGSVQWTANGVPLCTAPGNQWFPALVSDDASGAFVVWTDQPDGSSADIYALSIDANGRVGFDPHILSVQDVPQDQGGRVRITINRSKLDSAQEFTIPVFLYNVWQRIDNKELLALVAQGSGDGTAGARMSEAPLQPSVDASSVSDWPVNELNGRYFVQSSELLGAGFPPGSWELVGSFAACQQDQYIYRASTLADSAGSDKHYSVYMVTAHTTTPSAWFASRPDSGYSVDNLPPEVPVGLVAEQSYTPVGLQLTWDINQENDLSYYAVYRGLSEDFVPGPENRVATPTEPGWFDGAWRWDSGYYYKVSAIDVHDNQSGFALLTPDGVTGADTPKAPEASYLAQNYPNPFNPTTRIEYGLSAPAHVSLRIYDAAGRLVRALVNEERRAARYEEAWDGRDSNGRSVASGIYFYKLAAGSFESTKKMILLR